MGGLITIIGGDKLQLPEKKSFYRGKMAPGFTRLR